MAIHGFARATLAIDILIEEESLEKAYAVEIRRVSKIDSNGEVLSLDLLLVTSQVTDVWKNNEEIDFLGKTLVVVSREGLIKMKQLAGRPQDLVDIAMLIDEET